MAVAEKKYWNIFKCTEGGGWYVDSNSNVEGGKK